MNLDENEPWVLILIERYSAAVARYRLAEKERDDLDVLAHDFGDRNGPKKPWARRFHDICDLLHKTQQEKRALEEKLAALEAVK